MKLVCISDIHGLLPKSLPEGDVLVIAGDICPVTNHEIAFQIDWLNTTFREWLTDVCGKFDQIIACWGNHDWIGQLAVNMPDIVPALPWVILTDQTHVYKGVKFFGTPWQRRFYDWAFNMDPHQFAEKAALIPADIHVLISHGPPHGHGDLVTRNGFGEHTGSLPLTERIIECSIPITVCGHIHCANGEYSVTNASGGVSHILNVSMVDEKYRLNRQAKVVHVSAPSATGSQENI